VTVGVLALQGDFALHGQALERIGVPWREVRKPAELEGLAGLIMPGGESTTLLKLMDAWDFFPALEKFHAAGKPIFGTCAGLILLDRGHLGLMDIVAERNAFGRQLHSFEEDLQFPDMDGPPVRAVFIRAPWIAEHGPEVEVLAAVDGHPVAARQGGLLVISFHPELGDDDRLHRAFLEQVRAARNGAG